MYQLLVARYNKCLCNRSVTTPKNYGFIQMETGACQRVCTVCTVCSVYFIPKGNKLYLKSHPGNTALCTYLTHFMAILFCEGLCENNYEIKKA